MHLTQTMNGNFFSPTTNYYLEKIENQKKEAKEFDQKLKDLEQQETVAEQALTNLGYREE